MLQSKIIADNIANGCFAYANIPAWNTITHCEVKPNGKIVQNT